MKPQERIIHHLQRHPRLTAHQLARVVYQNQKTHEKSGTTYLNSLSSVQRVLVQMEAKRDKRGRPKAVLVKRQRRNLNEPDLWMLPNTLKIREAKYYHVKACGDLYASFGNLCD